jgi:hypothetical protein
VQHFCLERAQHTITTSALLKIANLGQRWVLAAGAQEVTEGFELNSAGAALVEQREGFFVVCAGLGGSHDAISMGFDGSRDMRKKRIDVVLMLTFVCDQGADAKRG